MEYGIILSRHKYSVTQYVIKQYTLEQAKKYGYIVKLSTNKKKKLDVCKDNIKIASLGDSLYRDYPTYIQERGLTFANVRRELYYKRHRKDIETKLSNGWLSTVLLW